MLRIDHGDLPEYHYEDAGTRDRFNIAAQRLEQEGMVRLEHVPGRPVIASIILNLEKIDEAYQTAHKVHPAIAAAEVDTLIRESLRDVATEWIQAWRDTVCQELRQTLHIPVFFRQGAEYARDFVRVLANYDRLRGSAITVRAFSSICFQNSKTFEQAYQDEFLRAATRFDPELAELSAQGEFGAREKLAFLGVYAHPEMYQLSGNCSILTDTGEVDLAPLFPFGVALPGSAVDGIVSIRFQNVKRIVWIENLTSYDEYLRTEIMPDELVIYHGGFLSPKKRQFMYKIAASLPLGMAVSFWADIDLGGFQMFSRLQKAFPQLTPLRMSADDVSHYAPFGLARDAAYLQRLQTALDQREFPQFDDSIRMILREGVTIEQEAFLLRV
ncbi:MAG: DUF2220 family protein [Peptococcaceae bacterium]|nr:DUF2220 family protein [Peptococcaceae bacterium]